MSGIFLNYRRSDSEAWAGRLHEALQERLPGVSIFRDIDNVPAGVKFSDHISKAVQECNVFITLIGPSWLNADATGNRRIDDNHDFVHIELAAALRLEKPIVPTLVGGATMPARESLPADLQGLADWQNHEIPSRLWNESCDRLASSLKQLLPTATPTPPPPTPTPAASPAIPFHWQRWGIVAAVVVVLGIFGILYNSRSGPALDPPQDANLETPPIPAVPPFKLEGSWIAYGPDGPEQADITVKQDSSVVEILVVTDRERLGLTVDLKPDQDLAEAILTENGRNAGKVTVHTVRQALEWNASLIAPRSQDGSLIEAVTGKGTLTADWRHWKGTLIGEGDPRPVDVSLDINNSDSELIWSWGAAPNERVAFRKK